MIHKLAVWSSSGVMVVQKLEMMGMTEVVTNAVQMMVEVRDGKMK